MLALYLKARKLKNGTRVSSATPAICFSGVRNIAAIFQAAHNATVTSTMHSR